MSEEQNLLIADVVNEIVDGYQDGSLISHSWLRQRSGISIPSFSDCTNTAEFIELFQASQFAYMAFVDALRWQLLENENLYLRNVRGDGYELLSPREQTKFGYDRFCDQLKKLIKETNVIMNNVRPVGSEQQAKDNDLRAKYSTIKLMFQQLRK